MANNTQDKRNAKGGGSVRQRPDGRWEARCTINGKSRSFYADKQQDALKAMRAAQKDADEGQYLEPSKMTVGQWLDIWMEEFSKQEIRPSTFAVRYGYIKNHIKPELGDIKLQSLNSMQLQSFVNKLHSKNKLAPTTVRTIFTILSTCLNQAVKLNYIQNNPATACKLPKKSKKEFVPLSPDDIAKFLNEIKGHRFEELFTLALFTGMRIGEILGLSWDAIDFKNNTITVKQQALNIRYKIIEIPSLAQTKNGKSRTLTVAPFIIELLKNVRKKQFAIQITLGPAWHNEHNLIFVNELGVSWSRACIWEHFKAIVTKIGRPDLRFHDLRHNYAVMALQEGDNPKIVQEALGHATARFTLDVYTHLSEKMKQDSAQRMQSYYEKIQA